MNNIIGWSALAGPIILNWGTQSFTTGNLITFNFARPFSVTPYSVIGISNIGTVSNTVVTVDDVNNIRVRFNVQNSGTPRTIYMMAVGPVA